MRIFLSYSHKSRKLAHEIKEGLTNFEVDVFLAHDDIVPSQRWRREIKNNLRRCQVFIPILTKGFDESEWTDQEAGFALALNKTIISLKVNRRPHGFLHSYQVSRWKRDSTY